MFSLTHDLYCEWVLFPGIHELLSLITPVCLYSVTGGTILLHGGAGGGGFIMVTLSL